MSVHTSSVSGKSFGTGEVVNLPEELVQQLVRQGYGGRYNRRVPKRLARTGCEYFDRDETMGGV